MATSSRNIVIVVHHLAVGLTVSGFIASQRVLEGTSNRVTLQVVSPDFPSGPFVVSGTDLPPNLTCLLYTSDAADE